MKRSLFLSFLLLLAAIADAQSYFTRVYEHDTLYTSAFPYGQCAPVQRTADGGYLLGSTILQAGFDYTNAMSYMIKTDSDFYPQWCKPKNCNDVYSLNSGSLLYFSDIIGFDTPAICSSGFGMEKLSLDGIPVWNERICSDSFSLHVGPSTMSDAHLRIAGGCYGSALPGYGFIAAMDTNGALISADTFAINGTRGVIVNLFGDTSGNVYPAFQYITSSQFIIAKVRADRTIAWSWLMASDYSYNISCMVAMPGGDVIYAMNHWSWIDFTNSITLVKFSVTGDLIWQRRINRLTRINDMKLLQNGNILVSSAGTGTIEGAVDHPMLEIDTAANVVGAKDISPNTAAWPHYIGVSVPYESIGGDLYFSAVTKDPFTTIVFNTNKFGVGACTTAEAFFTTTDTAFFALTPATVVPGSIPLHVTIIPNNDTAISYLTHTDVCRGVAEKIVKPATSARASIVPNPAYATINIVNPELVQQLELYDVAGRLTMTVKSNDIGQRINIGYLRNGTYLVRLYQTDGSVSNQKLVVLH